MSAVLVYGERVEVPDGWIAVCTGCVEPGDRELDGGLGGQPFCWLDFGDRIRGLSLCVSTFPLVIRRDPKETP